MGAISSKDKSNMSCSTNAMRSAGARVSSTTNSARPTESASCASCSGLTPAPRPTAGLGRCASRGSSRRDLRERNMSRHTRATTVVSHPPRFSMPLAVERLSRSQVSWTASSACSASRASGRPPPAGGCGGPRTVLQSNRARRSHFLVAFRHSSDERNLAYVTGERQLCKY
jgi:hypothetical protein